ncbi:MAG: prolyl oligopeptidase family serine peptidase [Rudaea sp.]
MLRYALAGTIATLVFSAAGAQTAPLNLEKIMADPDWIGAPVAGAYWSVDGKSAYYSRKRSGSPIVDLHRIEIDSGKDEVVDGAAIAASDAADAVFDQAGTRAAFVRNGDVFVRDLASGRLTQITRSTERKASPQFSADGRLLSFRGGHEWFVHDLATGVTSSVAAVKAEKDPDAPPKADDLRDMQLRTFSTLKKLHDDKETRRKHAEEARTADPTRAAAPFWLGEDVRVLDTELSPDARWMLVVTAPKKAEEGKRGELTRYVTESGYEEFEKERVRVGRNPPVAQSLQLLDLVAHKAWPLTLDVLPGIHDDPLKAVRDENAKLRQKDADEKKDARKDDKYGKHASEDKPKLRALRIVSDAEDGGGGGIAWNRSGSNVAIQLRAIDNKDRWIASVDFARHALVPQHRLSDRGWINWNFNGFGWLNDNATLWYESEESGYSNLYVKPVAGSARALIAGRFEVSHSQLSEDGRWFYVRANAEAPYAYDVYRVSAAQGKLERITHNQASENFSLSHDGSALLVTRSASYLPAQLEVAAAAASGSARALTDTRSDAFKAMRWVAPRIVDVPSTHFKGSIPAKFYSPADFDASKKHPAVLFVHGAGYTQNVHLGYPYYFREQMFHNLLLQQGYVVLDMDYRASEGYGREWRDAIYREMGHPELEDLLDGKKWLVDTQAVDPKRVGIYGGSYGGFMTLMALFRAPGEFAAGAALRPVTDWLQYNHEYTSDILNDPQIDPIAYRRSSPIEFADGLKDALLICHGVIDDNVLFADSMRIYQRLIELHKDNFTISPYALDRHGFSNADSWLDEYKRIYRLFEQTIGEKAMP